MKRAAVVAALFALLFLAGCQQGDVVMTGTPQTPQSAQNLAGQAMFTPDDFDAAGYAPPYDVWHSNKNVLVASENAQGDYSIQVDHDSNDVKMTYEQFWVYNAQTEQWNSLTAQGPRHPDFASFLVGDIDVALPEDLLGEGDNYVLGYTCTDLVPINERQAAYACGCSDDSLDSCGKWNMQRVTVEAEELAVCGDNTCQESEDFESCPQDCVTGPEEPEGPDGEECAEGERYDPASEECVEDSADRFLPSHCTVTGGWSCVEYTTVSEGVEFAIQNNLGQPAEDVVLTISSEECDGQTKTTPDALENGETIRTTLDCQGPVNGQEEESKIHGDITVTYRFAGQEVTHEATGDFVTTRPGTPTPRGMPGITEFALTEQAIELSVADWTSPEEYNGEVEVNEETIEDAKLRILAERDDDQLTITEITYEPSSEVDLPGYTRTQPITTHVVDGELTDLTGEDLEIFGQTYRVWDASIHGESGNGELTLKLADADIMDTLQEGETKTYTIDDTGYEVTNMVVSEDAQTKLMVNGEVTDTLAAGDTDALSDGMRILITEVIPATPNMSVELCVREAGDDDCDAVRTIRTGHSRMVRIDGADAEVTVIAVGIDGERAKILVNGAMSEALSIGDSQRLNNYEVEIFDIFPTTPFSQLLIGDADMDGELTVMDAQRIQAIVEGSPRYDYTTRLLDIDMDGDVTAEDAQRVSECVSGLQECTTTMSDYEEPNRFMPDMCTLSGGWECRDYSYKDGKLHLTIKNALGRDAESVSVAITSDECEPIDSPRPLLVEWSNGLARNYTFTLECPDAVEKARGEITINYTRADGAFNHLASGSFAISEEEGAPDDAAGDLAQITSFTADQSADDPLTYTFEAELSGDFEGVTYRLEFGDGTSTENIQATESISEEHTYEEEGPAVAYLYLYRDGEQVASAGRAITVSDGVNAEQPPEITEFKATPSSGPAGTNVVFSFTVDDPDANEIWWEFDAYPDTPGIESGMWGSYGEEDRTYEREMHYPTAGTYEVPLTVTDADGNTDSASTTVTIDEQPSSAQPQITSFTAEPAQAETGQPVRFSYRVTDADSNFVDRDLVYGDGQGRITGGFSTRAVHGSEYAYQQPGSYTATLTVTDTDGNTDTATKTVTVTQGATNEPPQITTFEANPSTITEGETVTFTYAVEDEDESVTVELVRGAGYGPTRPTGTTGQHHTVGQTYNQHGDYEPRLVVTDSAGNTAEEEIAITVDPEQTLAEPTASFTMQPERPVAGEEATFEFSVDSEAGGAQYRIDFGDGTADSNYQSVASGETVTRTHAYEHNQDSLTAILYFKDNARTAPDQKVITGIDTYAGVCSVTGCRNRGVEESKDFTCTDEPANTEGTADDALKCEDPAETCVCITECPDGTADADGDGVCEDVQPPALGPLTVQPNPPTVGEQAQFNADGIDKEGIEYEITYGDETAPSAGLSHTYDTPGEYDVTLTANKQGHTETVTKEKTVSVSCPQGTDWVSPAGECRDFTENPCGNGQVDSGEQCDGASVITCSDLGYGSGALECHPPGSSQECTYDTSSCTDYSSGGGGSVDGFPII